MSRLSVFIFLIMTINSFSQERELKYFIDKAQTNSPLLKDISNQLKSNSLDSLLNIATRKPQFNANIAANFAPVLNDGGYDVTVTNNHVVSGLVGVNQKIIGKNNRNNQLQIYKLIKDGLTTTKKIAVKDVNRAITSQYITVSATSEQIVYNEKTAAVLKEESKILKQLTQHSVYKQTDYLLFSATVKQQELVLLQLKQQYQNDLGMLYYIAGETDTTTVHLQKPNITLKDNTQNNKSIFFKNFENDSIKLQNQNRQIDFAYKPSISLLADAGYLSSFAVLPYANIGFSVGFGITVPIYDGGQRTLQHQKTSAALETNLAYKNNFKKQYQQQLLLLNQKLKQTQQLEKALQQQLKITETLIEAQKKLLLTGDAQITDFVLAITSIISIQNSISQNNINRLQVINDINYWSSNE